MGDFIKETWKELIIFIYWIFSYLNINIEVTVTLIIFMLCDTFIGALKAYKFKREVTFKKLFSGLMTKISVLLLPFLLALAARSLAPRYNFTGLVNTVLDIMLVSEFISILASIISIKTGKEVKNFDMITRLLKSLRNYLIRFAGTLFISVEENDDKKESN